MNLKKWISAITLCALTMGLGATGAAPAFADDADTAIVTTSPTPNLQAAAQAMAAAQAHLNGGSAAPAPESNGATQTPNSDTQAVNVDYVSLESPAVTIDGQTYLPLRATFAAMKDQALEVTWKVDGQQKVKLSNGRASYEVYLTSDGAALQLQQGGTTYAVKNVADTTYVPLSFFQAIVQSANISLSGDSILVLSAKDGASDLWNGLWGNMNAYQAPVVEAPTVERPDISYPDVSTPTVDNSVQLPSVDQETIDEIISGISDATRAQIVSRAMNYLGVPYVWGGTTPAGFDCSGLVQYVFAECGISVPRTTYEQQAAVQTISMVALEPGDLVFWGDSAYHVGIYIGDGQYIHAPAPGQCVKIQSYSEYPFTSAGRVLA